MNSKDKETHISRTMERFSKYGVDSRTLGWPKNNTWQRFKVLSEVGNLNNKTILDLGCGYADLYNWLGENGWQGKYIGYDIVPKYVEVARSRYPAVEICEIDILEKDISEKYDYVMACGVMNAKVLEENNDLYIEKMLSKMLQLARVAVSCDFLSPYVDFQGPWAYHPNMDVIIGIIRRLSKRFAIRHDYMPYEFTAYIYKNDLVDKELNIFEEKLIKCES